MKIRWPAVLFVSWLILLTLIPFLIIFGISFLEKSSLGTLTSTLTFSNYFRCFEVIYAKVLWKTLLLASGATLSCLIFGFPVAYYLARSQGSMRNFGLILLFIPFWTNFILRVHGMISLFGRKGLLNQFLINIGLITEPLEILYTPLGVYLGLVYNYLPFLVVPIFSSLEKFDSTLREAAWDLGASRFQTFWKVVVPNIKGGVIIGSLFVFIPMMGEYVIPDLMGGGKQMYLGKIMVDQFYVAQDWPFGSAIASILSIFLIIALWFQSKWSVGLRTMKVEN